MIKLRFIDDRGLAADAIKFWTWSQISHVEFVFDDGYFSAYIPKVGLKPFNYANPKHEWFGTVDCTPEQAQIIEAFARSQAGKNYDYLQILGIVMHEDWANTTSWFCSYLIFASIAQGGILLLDREKSDRITPYDIFTSPLVKVTSA